MFSPEQSGWLHLRLKQKKHFLLVHNPFIYKVISQLNRSVKMFFNPISKLCQTENKHVEQRCFGNISTALATIHCKCQYKIMYGNIWDNKKLKHVHQVFISVLILLFKSPKGCSWYLHSSSCIPVNRNWNVACTSDSSEVDNLINM